MSQKEDQISQKKTNDIPSLYLFPNLEPSLQAPCSGMRFWRHCQDPDRHRTTPIL